MFYVFRVITDKYGFIVRKRHTNFEAYQRYLDQQLPMWEKLMSTYPENFNPKSRSIKQMIRQGIPDKYRPKLWLEISGAAQSMKQNVGYFESLLKTNKDKSSSAIREINEVEKIALFL